MAFIGNAYDPGLTRPVRRSCGALMALHPRPQQELVLRTHMGEDPAGSAGAARARTAG